MDRLVAEGVLSPGVTLEQVPDSFLGRLMAIGMILRFVDGLPPQRKRE